MSDKAQDEHHTAESSTCELLNDPEYYFVYHLMPINIDYNLGDDFTRN